MTNNILISKALLIILETGVKMALPLHLVYVNVRETEERGNGEFGPVKKC